MTKLLGFLVVLAAWLFAAGVAAAQVIEQDDPALEQTIDADAEVVEGETFLAEGHVDVGPLFVDGEWRFMVHDDTVSPSVWRSFGDTVLVVADTAVLPAPDDPTYEFLRSEPGTELHVVPQTQNPEVIWLGWNTQDPEVMDAIDRGATFTLRGVDGPGEVIMYLHAGDLSEPDVLWDSEVTEPQPLWVEVNTHAHANWVFTEPGVYLLDVEISADLADGSEVGHTDVLRFAVGDGTDPADALAAEFTAEEPEEPEASGEDPDAGEAADEEAEGGVPAVVAVAAIAAAALLVGAVIMVLVRGSSARKRAERQRERS